MRKRQRADQILSLPYEQDMIDVELPNKPPTLPSNNNLSSHSNPPNVKPGPTVEKIL